MRPPIIVAEAGNNHEGNFQVAIELLERAREAGADLVKFQAGTAEGFARKPEDIQRYRKYELGAAAYHRLVEHGKTLGIPVFFSVFGDDPELSVFRRLPWFKIAARQCTQAYINAHAHDQTLISIPHTMDPFRIPEISRGIPLHCVSEYPAGNPHLARISKLREQLGMAVGYSDHTVGIEACVQAVQMNALVIEKHFTLKHDFGPLRDHALSATPEEMRELVERTKNGW